MNSAPKNNLPKWKECALRVGNKTYIEENGLSYNCGSLLPNPIHEFIYEYDDVDPFKSEWFMHRLEKLIDFVKEEANSEFINKYVKEEK